MPYVYSTLTQDNSYAEYVKNENLVTISRKVFVKGGAGVSDKHRFTPIGAETEIENEDVEFLKGNKIFNLHEKNGFVKILDKKFGLDKVISDMQARDKSSPKRPEDYEAIDEDKRPHVNNESDSSRKKQKFNVSSVRAG